MVVAYRIYCFESHYNIIFYYDSNSTESKYNTLNKTVSYFLPPVDLLIKYVCEYSNNL